MAAKTKYLAARYLPSGGGLPLRAGAEVARARNLLSPARC